MVSIVITKTTNWTCLFCPDIINSETSNTETGIEKASKKASQKASLIQATGNRLKKSLKKGEHCYGT